MREPLREIAVVREQQQAFGVLIEAPDGKHARLGGHELGHDRAAVRVGRGRHDAGGLVEQVVDEPGLRPDAHAVDLDAIGLGVGLVAERRHRAVDRDRAGLDQLLAVAPAPARPARARIFCSRSLVGI